jgi:hypothetical protein
MLVFADATAAGPPKKLNIWKNPGGSRSMGQPAPGCHDAVDQ